MNNKTTRFLGPQFNWNKTQIELSDDKALGGRVHVLLPSFTAYQVFITHVAPGGEETKYKLPLGREEKKELCALCAAHDFVTIPTQDDPERPDEARSTITLTNARRESHTVARSAVQASTNPGFDAIYQVLLALAERAVGQRPMVRQLEPWQKWLLTGALVLILALPAALAYFAARALVAAWWSVGFYSLFGMHVVLMGLLLAMMALLGRFERHKLWWDRTFTNPFMLAVLNLFFFLALVGATGMLEEAIAIWRGATLPQVVDERAWYGVLAYGGLFAAWLTLLAAAVTGKPLLNWLDERW